MTATERVMTALRNSLIPLRPHEIANDTKLAVVAVVATLDQLLKDGRIVAVGSNGFSVSHQESEAKK